MRLLPVSGCVLLIALLSNTDAVVAQEVPSADAQARMLDLMQQQSLYRDRVDWPKVRADLAAVSEPAEVRRLLDDVIKQSSGGHGRWISARQLRGVAPRARATQAAMIATSTQETGAAEDHGDRLGSITVNGYLDDVTQPRETQYQARKGAAVALQTRIRNQDDGRRCGWVVDLRGNGGGNMWPMLLGVGPLLADARGSDPVGMFISGGQRTPWAYREGAVWWKGRAVIGSRDTGYTLREPGAPVAALFGARTGSSGEAMVLAFRGRHMSRSFGQPSGGYSTANTVQRLPDGSQLLLTVSLMVDRNGNGDGGKLIPDVVVGPGEDPAVAARAWLLAQPACLPRQLARGTASLIK